MLRELHISGLGVIADLDLEFDPGLNVITGETGAGKTMVTVGLALALGRRAAATLVRVGEPSARVQARFDGPLTPAVARWADEGEVVLARTVSSDGRSSARIGGELTSVSALAEMGDELVEILGQSQGRLFSSASHTGFLDRFAGHEHVQRVAMHRETWERLERIEARLDELTRGDRDREREADLLVYQIREIEAAGIRPGELAELQAEERRLANAERLMERAAEAGAAIGAEGGGSDTLRRAAASLADAAAMDGHARVLLERASSLAEEAVELARDVRAYRDGMSADPQRLQEVRERAQALGAMRRKYGDTEEDILRFGDEARTRLRALAGADGQREALQREAAPLRAELGGLRTQITGDRSAAAPLLEAAIRAELSELGMRGAVLSVVLLPSTEPSPTGAERAEFVFAGGTGQAPMPIAKVASGGELSRTMLACRSVLADLDDVPTLVFDEVDAGIGGRAAVAVGRRLARLARSRQVVVVTHLPQIAAFADRHLRVDKREGTATVEMLDDSGRLIELSRMLSGLPRSAASDTHAEELLTRAGRSKGGRAGHR